MSEFWKTGLFYLLCNFIYSCSIENWCREFHSKFLASPSENSFIYLPKVHTAWYTKRIQHNINCSSVFKERHIFLANDLCNDAFVPVTACHFISHFQFTLN